MDSERLIWEARSRRFNNDPVAMYIQEYLWNEGGPKVGVPIEIPLVGSQPMIYTRREENWYTHRLASTYSGLLYGDQFLLQRNLDVGYESPPATLLIRDPSEIIAGGIDFAFASGKVVVDFGSGGAVALLEYAKRYPDTVFIGIDSNYAEERVLDLEKPGVQLTKGDWNRVSLPDGSVDTFISVAGGFTHGGQKEKEVVNQYKIAGEVSRLAKGPAVLRFIYAIEDEYAWKAKLEARGWQDLRMRDTAAIFVKAA